MNPMSLRILFGAFVRLGATAFGGPAMMAYLRQEYVGKRQWLTEQEFKDGMALCHLIPGATMMQMSVYVGYRLRGLPGATVAAIGFTLPAFLLMNGLSAAYFAFGDLAPVRAMFVGLGAIVVAIILNACVSLRRTVVQGWQGGLIAVLAFGASSLRANLLLVLLGAALLALVLFWTTVSPGAPDKGGAR
jgi:chromate transporter